MYLICDYSWFICPRMLRRKTLGILANQKAR
jgi:hypothetical protein